MSKSNQTNNSHCPQLAEMYKKLTTLKSDFEADLIRAQTTIKNRDIQNANNAIKEAKVRRLEITKIISEIQVVINPFEKLMNFSEQYKSQKNILIELGDLEKLSNGQLGIKGIDPVEPMDSTKTKEYIFPSRESILKALLAKKEFYQLKMSQGFTRLLITPFALPLDKLADKYGKELVKKFQANGNKLYSADPDPYYPSSILTALPTQVSRINKMILTEDSFIQADISGNLKYYHHGYNSDYDGHTKSDILKDANHPFPGFHVTFLHQNPIILKDTTDKSPAEYLTLTQTQDKKSIYYGASGQTPEEALNINRQTLNLTNQVLGDYEGNDKANYCLGAYLDGSGRIPIVYYNRIFQRVDLLGAFSTQTNPNIGSRQAVRVL